MEIILAQPRGFCAGVSRAIDIVEHVLAIEQGPIYVRHEVVHNRFVVDDLKQKGAIFVEEIDEVPEGSVVVFSAHGVSKAVVNNAKIKNLIVYDATCPLVTKVHKEVQFAGKDNQECILIGHAGHPEVEGTLGQYQSQYSNIHLVESLEDVTKLSIQNSGHLIYVTQTTLSLDETSDIINALRLKFPNITAPKKEDICYATQNRQNAVKQMAEHIDIMLVVGSKNSSNSNRLRELAEKYGKPAYLLDHADMVDAAWFQGVSKVGVTAGASAPEVLVQKIIQAIQDCVPQSILKKFEGIEERVFFPLPKLLKMKLKQKEGL